MKEQLPLTPDEVTPPSDGLKQSLSGDMRLVTVVARSRRDFTALLRLSNGSQLVLPAFSPVGPDDQLLIGESSCWVKPSQSEVPIPVIPAWSATHDLRIGRRSIRVTIKEVESEREFVGLQRLTEYHYRGAGGAGRTVPLIACVESYELPPIVGFLEVASTFLVNSARKRLFDKGFSEPSRKVAWTKWDLKTAGKFSSVVARISRCVVYPELRGWGLSSLLVDAAISYARDRWHYGAHRPLFLEITADMLRYFPFVEKNGFVYIGDTEGNEHRLMKDMRYLLGRSVGKRGMPKGGGGIMSLQRSYATRLAAILRERKTSLEALLRTLRIAPEQLSDDEWILLHKVYRRPKPTYIIGLTKAAMTLAKRGAGNGRTSRQKRTAGSNKEAPLVSIDRVGLEVKTTPDQSARSRAVQEAFGIVGRDFTTTLLRPIDIAVKPGEILLISGPSGTGKSLLLRAISRLTDAEATLEWPASAILTGDLRTKPVTQAWLERPSEDKAPIDLLNNLTIEAAIRTLATAGLAEPQLYVRQASRLSEGQYYRLTLALALARNAKLLFADAFCEPLDRFSAAAVAQRLRSYVDISGTAAIVATADPHKLVASLRPNQLLVLSSTGDATWRAPEEMLAMGSDT